MGACSRRKGAAWERALVHRFRDAMPGAYIRRGLQYRDGAECADVIAPKMWLEAKHHHRTNLRAALAQAQEASRGRGLWPIAICKDDRQPATVTLVLDDFLELVREWWALKNR